MSRNDTYRLAVIQWLEDRSSRSAYKFPIGSMSTFTGVPQIRSTS